VLKHLSLKGLDTDRSTYDIHLERFSSKGFYLLLRLYQVELFCFYLAMYSWVFRANKPYLKNTLLNVGIFSIPELVSSMIP